MPQNEDFWNPYRLIPVRDTVERSAPLTDEKFRGHSGLIACTLENLTPLFIGAKSSGNVHPPLLRDSKRVIPGSSLKGMVRSLAEIVGGGCFVVSNDKDKERIPKSPVPDNMKTCSNISQLCIACRMFGAMSNARVHKGKVTIGDALIQETRQETTSLQVLLSSNGVRHEPFYRSPANGVRDGKSRKLYFHQPKRTADLLAIHGRPWNIDALLPGHHFNFEVQFTSLTDTELSLLLYTLCLEENVDVVIGGNNADNNNQNDQPPIHLKGPMRHKIGNAKPLGLGSCHIKINRLTFFLPPAQRFTTLSAQSNRILENKPLSEEIRQRIDNYIKDNSATMQALRKMMVWDITDNRDFHYPGFPWFSSPANHGITLKSL